MSELYPEPGRQSTGTILVFRCTRCGEKNEVRVHMAPLHLINHERKRAERAEARVVELETQR